MVRLEVPSLDVGHLLSSSPRMRCALRGSTKLETKLALVGSDLASSGRRNVLPGTTQRGKILNLSSPALGWQEKSQKFPRRGRSLVSPKYTNSSPWQEKSQNFPRRGRVLDFWHGEFSPTPPRTAIHLKMRSRWKKRRGLGQIPQTGLKAQAQSRLN